jgi:hypothetical protein
MPKRLGVTTTWSSGTGGSSGARATNARGASGFAAGVAAGSAPRSSPGGKSASASSNTPAGRRCGGIVALVQLTRQWGGFTLQCSWAWSAAIREQLGRCHVECNTTDEQNPSQNLPAAFSRNNAAPAPKRGFGRDGKKLTSTLLRRLYKSCFLGVADVGRGRRTRPFVQKGGGMSDCRPWRGSVRRCRPTPLVSSFPLEAQNCLHRSG